METPPPDLLLSDPLRSPLVWKQTKQAHVHTFTKLLRPLEACLIQENLSRLHLDPHGSSPGGGEPF